MSDVRTVVEWSLLGVLAGTYAMTLDVSTDLALLAFLVASFAATLTT